MYCEWVVEWNPQFWHMVELLEIPLLHVLSSDACRFTINLFPISWEPFENVNLLYLLLQMWIWNGCNMLHIAGNPIEDMQWKTYISDFNIWHIVLTSGGNHGNSTFACPLQWCIQIYHKPFPHQLRTIWNC